MHPAVITRANECLPVLMTAAQFARSFQITERAARKAFETAAAGNTWRGFHLPVIALPGNRGGAGGKVWALAVDRCEPALKAKLGVVEGPFEAPVKRAFKAEVAACQWDEQADRLRIIAPILDTPKRTAERAAAYRAVAAQVHMVRGVPTRIAENTLRDWVLRYEVQGPSGLVHAARSDKGAARVLVTREWDAGIDLPMDRRAVIAEHVARLARSMVFTCDRALPPAGDAPDWVHLLPPGRMEGRDGRSYELADPSGLILAFQSGGIDLPVDYEHQNDKPEARLSGPVPAAGWIKELKADAIGLWGRVEWTATAREMIGRREYRYLSPSFLHNKAGQIMRLRGAGLVHNPNLYLTALASQEGPMDPTKTPPKDGTSDQGTLADFVAALDDLLGLPPETPPKAILAKLKDQLAAEPDPAKYMPVEAVQSMLANRMEERLALSAAQAEEKVNRAFGEGYLTTAMKPWALSLCRSNEAAFDDFLAKSGPVFGHLLKPSHATGAPPASFATEAAASDLERAICEQLGLKPGELQH